MLRIITRPAIIWAAPVARALMCAILVESQLLHKLPLTQWLLLLWAAWALITVAATAIGHYFSIRELQLIATMDAVIAVASIMVISVPDTAVAAFLICSAVMVLGCGLGPLPLAILYALPVTAWSLRQIFELTANVFPRMAPIETAGINGLTLLIQLCALAAIAALVHRKSRTELFAKDCNSVAMVRPDRSFEFDLQHLVDNLAKIFAPERAFCVLSSPAANAGYRHFERNCDPGLLASSAENFLAAAEALPKSAAIYDIEGSRCQPLDSGTPRPFSDAEQKFAHYLKRQQFPLAFVQPLQIGRARGVIACAALKPIDACLLVDARSVETNVSGLMTFLSGMAEAERRFIADAHDVARRDLHDGVLQSMAALRMKLLTIANRSDVKGHPAQLDLRKAADILTLEQVRLRGLLEISESENDTINLVARLDICLRAISLQWEIDVKLESDDPAVPVDRETALSIEHLVREAVANAVRHAKISALTVTLSLKQYALLIAIQDRAGAAAKTGKGGTSMPLQSGSLQHRLRLVNGTAYAEGLGKGTLLAISIPMQQVDDA